MSSNYVKLRDIARLEWGNTSITKSSYVEFGFPAFSAAGQDGFLDHAEFEVDGIVLSAIGARCGKCFKAKGKWTAIKNTITIIPNTEKVDLNYLFIQLNEEKSWKVSGAAQPFITLGTVRDRLIQLPPLAEQKRIAELLDTADRILQLRASAIAKLDELALSTFNKIQDSSTEKARIDQLFEINSNRIVNGINDDDLVSFVPMSAVSENSKRIEIHAVKKFLEVKKGYTPIKKGDLIIAKITPCYENGKMAIADNMETEIGFGSTEFHTIRCGNPSLTLFAYYFLQRESIRIVGAKNMKGAAGQRRVPANFFAELEIPLLSEKSLNEFSEQISSIQRRREVMKSSQIILSNLKNSLQHQSFAVN